MTAPGIGAPPLTPGNEPPAESPDRPEAITRLAGGKSLPESSIPIYDRVMDLLEADPDRQWDSAEIAAALDVDLSEVAPVLIYGLIQFDVELHDDRWCAISPSNPDHPANRDESADEVESVRRELARLAVLVDVLSNTQPTTEGNS